MKGIDINRDSIISKRFSQLIEPIDHLNNENNSSSCLNLLSTQAGQKIETLKRSQTSYETLKPELARYEWSEKELLHTSTVRMLVQIGQAMVTAEQQISIASDARKLIEQLDMNSLQELRLVIKAEKPVEDTLAAIIMILKSPTADITRQKDAKRQLANLDRFIEETQLFAKINLSEEHIDLTSAIIDKVELENISLNQTSYYNTVLTLYKWI
ncbi:unnamed protein product [Adineta steineri]|uniref:Uncharacterized protein n=1 Tax=Adineta steineri TaxID=433720 RepID=A0A815J5E6_9BILA|nr:unnamed protein product [Adineta steineri]CAF1374708.1 unnamed protein product [Adineta steineri]